MMKDSLLTQLQFAVIDCLQSQRLKGRELRGRLEEDKSIKKEGPAFYMMMGRMEEAGLIQSVTSDLEIGGKIYKEKEYWVTRDGYLTYQHTRAFYSGDGSWLPIESGISV